jgi:hypothetical protein
MSTKVFISLIIIIGVVVGLANLYLLRDYWWGESANQSYAQQAQNLSTFSPPPMLDSSNMIEADIRDPFDDESISSTIEIVEPDNSEIGTNKSTNTDNNYHSNRPKIEVSGDKNTDFDQTKTTVGSDNSHKYKSSDQTKISNHKSEINQSSNIDTADIEITPESKSDFIRRYYRDLKTVPYEQTWAMLSSRFQSKHSLKKYINWWSKNVDSVFLERVVSVKGKSITVRLQYKMKNGKKVCSRDTFDLIQSEQSWLLDKHRYRNCR